MKQLHQLQILVCALCLVESVCFKDILHDGDLLLSGVKIRNKHAVESDALEGIKQGLMNNCIKYFKVEGHTESLDDHRNVNQNPLDGVSFQLSVKSLNRLHYASIIGKKNHDEDVVHIVDFFPPFPSGCLTQEKIEGVHLKVPEGSSDGWFMKSISIFTAGSDLVFTLLTSDPNLKKWVDEECIRVLKILVTTGSTENAGYKGPSHSIVLKLANSHELKGDLESNVERGSKFSSETKLANFLGGHECVRISDITEVRLEQGNNDGWFIEHITTLVKDGTKQGYQKLTDDPKLNKWLDGNEHYQYDATRHVLSLNREHTPLCGIGTKACECRDTAEVCIFSLEIDTIRTFTSYPKNPNTEGKGMYVKGEQALVYNIEDNGEERPLEDYKVQRSKYCALNRKDCSDPQYVDGKTYRMAIGVNGQIPGPTIIVHDKQKVMVHVHNNLTTEGISIHWHGMHQIGTPWMDGVGQITQCHIGPSSSFTYVFTANPTGSFWYHSHSGGQRTDGFLGALIVKEKPDRLKAIQKDLASFDVVDFQDFPDKHSIALMDWWAVTSLDLMSQIDGYLGLNFQIPTGQVPTSNDSIYKLEYGPDGATNAPIPYYSGLINGKDESKIPYVKTRLSVFTVQQGRSYRFRLVGTQNTFSYKFSIDKHKLIVVNTDGVWIEPKTVDYIIIQTGERYDFILRTSNVTGNYWIRAETLEVNKSSNGGDPPYKLLNHAAEAILQCVEDFSTANHIPSSEYAAIKHDSPECHSYQRCSALNCPFKAFHPSYNIDCINVEDLRLLEPTPAEEMPDAHPSSGCPECLHFVDFNFNGYLGTSSVNGRTMLLPPAPPVTQNDDFKKQAKMCDLNADCNPLTFACSCTHVINIPYKKTVQLVLSTLELSQTSAHPIHLHGHSFHVVHVGYPDYDPVTGFLSKKNLDIYCDDPNMCTKPSWAKNFDPSFHIDTKTIRKDTVTVPAGGYVVINFLSNNPGYWFLHCHIMIHQAEGMSLIVNEAFEQQKFEDVPNYFNKCGDAIQTTNEYNEQDFLPRESHKHV